MASQFGICNNKVGCSLAYTGEKIPVPPGGACPECGQPLATDAAPKKGGNKALLVILLLVGLLAVAAAGTLFLFRDQLAQLAFHNSEPKRKVLELPESEDKAVVKEAASPAASSDALAANAATPAATAQLADQATTPPQLADSGTDRSASANTPPTPPPATSPSPVAVSADTPQAADQLPTPPPAPTPSNVSTQTSPPPPSKAQPPAGGEDQVQPAAALSKAEVDAARQDVVKRINAMPKLSADEKQRLTEKMETARSMERLFVVRFAIGQTSVGKAAVDALAQKFKSKEVQDKISDPTVVFVVAGYADTAGDPKKNLQLSEQRAENVTRFLKERTNLLNVVHSVGMGSTELLDSKRTDPNRAVEIWVVSP
jgi:outer membrane protein OmpA-like peptidoglycan-associated protein